MRTWLMVVLLSLGGVSVLSAPVLAQAPTSDVTQGQEASRPFPCTAQDIVNQGQKEGVTLTCVAPYGMTAPVACPFLPARGGKYMHLVVDGSKGVGTYTCPGVDKLTGQANPSLERYSTPTTKTHGQGFCELNTKTSPPGQTVTVTCVVVQAPQ